MKAKIFSLLLLSFTAVSVVNAQVSDIPKKHTLSLGPIVGYNLDMEGLTYGAGLLYEFRPFEKVGFTAGFNYGRTRSDVSGDNWGELNGSEIYGDVRTHQVYSLNLGARYYMNQFYLTGSLGVAYDEGETKLSDGSISDGGHKYGLYKSVGAGYQIPLKNNHAIEFEAGYFGSEFMNVGGTVRYRFGK